MSYIFSLIAIVISFVGALNGYGFKNPEPILGVTTVPIQQGGTGTSTLSANSIVLGNGTNPLFASSSPSHGALYATSSIATSTLRYGLNVETGCLAVGGVCLSTATGITSLGGLTGAVQTFSGMTALNDAVSVVSAGTDHKITLAQTANPLWTTIKATSSTASSTINWGFNVIQGISVGGTATTTIRGDLASSTFSGGILSSGTGNFTGGVMTANAINNTGSATSSFTGGITSAGLQSSNGATITGGSLLITSTASSTFSGGLTVVGLRSTAGIVNTVGSINNEGTATSTWAGGLQLTGSANVCNAAGTCLSSLTAITSLNGLTGGTQTFSGMTALNDSVNVVSAGTDHKITLAQTATPAWTTIRATSTTASSTISWGLNVIQGVSIGGTGTTTIRGDSASSTFGGGILSSGTGNFTGGLMLGNSLNSTFTATSSFSGGITLNGLTSTGHGLFSGRGGFGTTTMVAVLGIQGDSVPLLMVASSTAGVSTGRNALVVSSNGLVGIGGTSTPQSALSIVGSGYSQEHKLTAATSMDIDWSKANQQLVTMTANTTFSFSNGRDGGAYRLVACQDGTGGRTITWPATTTLHWQGVVVKPTESTQQGRCDVFSFIVTSATSSTIYLGVGAIGF